MGTGLHGGNCTRAIAVISTRCICHDHYVRNQETDYKKGAESVAVYADDEGRVQFTGLSETVYQESRCVLSHKVPSLCNCSGGHVRRQSHIVQFNKVRKGLGRAPIAHTCGPVLELPSTYCSYNELRGEFTNLLERGYLKIDIL